MMKGIENIFVAGIKLGNQQGLDINQSPEKIEDSTIQLLGDEKYDN